MLTIIFCWLVLFACLFLIGKVLYKKAEWYESFWIGFAVVVALLQIWSIFLPVNYIALIFIFVISSLSFVFLRKTLIFKPKLIKNWIRANKTFLIIISLVLIVVAYYASQPVGWDDTLLYHLNAVKWSKLYPVVPGLANLHTRLGFNSSFFLFASMLDSWFMSDRSSHLALSVLAAALSIEYVWIMLKSDNKLLRFFCLFTTPLIFYSIATREIIASLSPDFAMTIITLAACVEFIKKEKISTLVAALISIVLFTVKFSALSFSVVLILLVFLKNRSLWKWILMAGILIIVPYLIRNVYLSGWLLYPLPYLGFNVSWAVPFSTVRGVYIIIQTWAKVPGTEWVKFVDAPFWKWFPVWYQDNGGAVEVKMLFSGLLLTFLSPVFGVVNKKFLKENKEVVFLVLSSLASIVYVFYTAPDLRFGGTFVWVFFAAVLSIYFGLLKWDINTKIFTVLITLVFLLLVSWPVRFDNEPILKSVRWDPAWPTKKVNGILVPLKEDFCGNSDLPCTPETNNIREIVPGDISRGFAPIR